MRTGPIEHDPTVLEIGQLQPKLVPQFVQGGETWATAGYGIYRRSAGGPWAPVTRVPSRSWQDVAGRTSWLSLGLRLGIHRLLRLRSGSLLAVLSGRLLRSDDAGKTFSTVHRFEGVSRPAGLGSLEDDRGRIFIGEYVSNPSRSRPIRIWRSDDDGRTFEEVFRFSPGDVRHVHFLQQDPADGSIWMGTGDSDSESAILRSEDGGERFERIGAGDQRWRAIAVVFRTDAVLWGTDAGSDAGDFRNRVLRWERSSGELEEQMTVQGPVHGITGTSGGGILLSTGVEGGSNETDDRVHLWYSSEGSTWREIAAWRKGRQPKGVQYAVAHFMPRQDSARETFVILRGIRGCAIGHVVVRLLPEAAS